MLIRYIDYYLPHLPLWHWGLMVVSSVGLSVLLLRRRKTLYSHVTLAITLFLALFLLDCLVINRFSNINQQYSGLDLNAELNRLTHIDWVFVFFNVLLFFPFGFFLSEFFTEVMLVNPVNCLLKVSITAICFSLLLEILQYTFHIGFFELSDILLNTVGAIIGALLALSGRKLIGSFHGNK